MNDEAEFSMKNGAPSRYKGRYARGVAQRLVGDAVDHNAGRPLGGGGIGLAPPVSTADASQ